MWAGLSPPKPTISHAPDSDANSANVLMLASPPGGQEEEGEEGQGKREREREERPHQGESAEEETDDIVTERRHLQVQT